MSYESLLRCVAAGCGVPVAALSLLSGERYIYRAGALTTQSGPLDDADIAQTVATQPIYGRDGAESGVLAIGTTAHEWDEEQRARLRDFAELAGSLFHSGREHALRRLMSRAVEEALDFVLITDASDPATGGPFIEYANSSLLYALGYTSDELIGLAYHTVFAPTNDPATLQSFAQNLASARDNEKELQLRRKDGSTFWAECTGRPLLDAGGKPTHWFMVGRDITSNRENLTQIAALVNALDTVADHVEIYAVEGDRYELAFANRAAQPHISTVAQRLLADACVRQSLNNGETVRKSGLMLRPIAGGDTVICVRRQPGRFAAAS